MNRRVLLELREIIKREEKLLSGYREEAKGIKGGPAGHKEKRRPSGVFGKGKRSRNRYYNR